MFMGTYRVCVYAICKNEGEFVERWMNSMSEADMVVVIDTGSTDDTVEKLKSIGAVVYEEQIEPWRFDTARNISLTYVPDDIDICVCTDLDEAFEPGWRKQLEQSWEADAHRGNYWFNWRLKEDVSPDTQFVYFKVHTRKDFVWEGPVHEYLRYTGNAEEKRVFINGMVLNHYPDAAKSRSSYMPLLELAVHEKPDDERYMYYLGREYFYTEQWNRCIQTLEKHLSLPLATWKEERCASMRWIAKAYDELGDYSNSSKWFYRAVAECPYMREPYVECAMSAYLQKEWEKVFFFSREALKINEKSLNYVNMGYAWDETPHDLAGLACYWLGMFIESSEHFQEALAYAPNDERLNRNLALALTKSEGSIFAEDCAMYEEVKG